MVLELQEGLNMRYLSFNHIAKRCPNGQWKDPEDGRCISQAEWKRKYRKNAPAEEESPKDKKKCPKGYWKDRRTGECIKITEWKDRPKARGKKKEDKKKEDTPKAEKKEFRENYSSEGYASTKLQNIALNSFKESVETAFEKNGCDSPFKKTEEKIIKIDGIISSKKIKPVDGLKTIGISVDNPRNINGIFKGENKTALFEGIKSAMLNCPYIYSAFRSLGSRQLGKASGEASQDGDITFNSAYFKDGDTAYLQKSAMYPKPLTSPNGVEDDTVTWWFQTFPDAKSKDEIMGMPDEQATQDYIKSVITHEIGHQMGYKYCTIMHYVSELEDTYRIVFNEEPPKDVPLKDIETMIFNKQVEVTGSGVKSNKKLSYLLEYPWSAPSRDIMDIELDEVDSQCKMIYSEIYGIPVDEINPFDIYSAYGYYGKSMYLATGKQAPEASENDRTHFVHERVAEAFADVCNRGENANSMSKIIVAYMNYRIGQKLGNSSEAVSFKKYLFKVHPELKEEMKNNRRVKSLRKYILHSQLI